MHNRRTLKTDLDIIKFYFDRYQYYIENKGTITEYGVLITENLIKITLERLLQLMNEEWRGIFEEQNCEN